MKNAARGSATMVIPQGQCPVQFFYCHILDLKFELLISYNWALCDTYVSVWDMSQLQLKFLNAETCTGDFRGVKCKKKSAWNAPVFDQK